MHSQYEPFVSDNDHKGFLPLCDLLFLLSSAYQLIEIFSFNKIQFINNFPQRLYFYALFKNSFPSLGNEFTLQHYASDKFLFCLSQRSTICLK
jgi:hypothetical protein